MGGKAFEGTVPLPKEKLYVLNEVSSFLKDFDYTIVGSGRNPQDSWNDIDYAAEATDIAWGLLRSNFANAGIETRTITPHSFSAKMTDGPDAYQFDFMQSANLAFTSSMYHVSTASNYKGVHRNILLMALVKVMTAKEHRIDGTDIIRTRQHLDLYDGLVYMVQHKRIGVQRYTTIDKQRLSLDFVGSIRNFLPNIQWYHLDSLETVAKAITDHFFVGMGNTSKTIEIFQEALDMMTSHKIRIPSEILVWANVPTGRTTQYEYV